MFLLILRKVECHKGTVEVSIHPMFLLITYFRITTMYLSCFNTSHVSINLDVNAQIPKVCDRFNTSHVSINRLGSSSDGNCYLRFNTSHVSINQRDAEMALSRLGSFNTSHVSINPLRFHVRVLNRSVSIHPMFLLILAGSYI